MCSRVPVAQNYPERQQVLSKSARDFWGKGYYLHFIMLFDSYLFQNIAMNLEKAKI